MKTRNNSVNLYLLVCLFIQCANLVVAGDQLNQYSRNTGDTGQYIDYFRHYYAKTWEQANPVKRHSMVGSKLKEHRKIYNAYSKIAVLDVKQIAPDTKRIHYYYQSWYQNTFPKSYWVTIRKKAGGNGFKVISLHDSDFELYGYLRKHFRKSYRKMKGLFASTSYQRLLNIKSPDDLPILSASTINSIYLNPIYYNDVRFKDSKYFPLYSFRYEKGVMGYLVHTPQCYGKPRSGIVLFVINEKKLNFELFGKRSNYKSRILIKEPLCRDGEEKWNTQGYFVDVNKDGYIDIVVRHQFKKRRKKQRFKLRTHYYQYTYRGKGRYRFRRISQRRFNRLIR